MCKRLYSVGVIHIKHALFQRRVHTPSSRRFESVMSLSGRMAWTHGVSPPEYMRVWGPTTGAWTLHGAHAGGGRPVNRL